MFFEHLILPPVLAANARHPRHAPNLRGRGAAAVNALCSNAQREPPQGPARAAGPALAPARAGALRLGVRLAGSARARPVRVGPRAQRAGRPVHRLGPNPARAEVPFLYLRSHHLPCRKIKSRPGSDGRPGTQGAAGRLRLAAGRLRLAAGRLRLAARRRRGRTSACSAAAAEQTCLASRSRPPLVLQVEFIACEFSSLLVSSVHCL